MTFEVLNDQIIIYHIMSADRYDRHWKYNLLNQHNMKFNHMKKGYDHRVVLTI